jgi:alpha-tubulin suppressor-like RCC1 family protein
MPNPLKLMMAAAASGGDPQGLFSWGADGQGDLGHNDRVSSSSPVQIGTLTTWTSHDIFNLHLVALKSDRTVWVWGQASNGKLGLGDTISKSSPTQLGALTTWAHVSCGENTTQLIKTDGTLWVMGRGYIYGALGLGTAINYSSPVQVGSLTNWSKTAGGARTVLAIKTDGTLWAWGDAAYGKTGQGAPTSDNSSPVQIGSLTTWADIDFGNNFALARKTDGTLWTWGKGNVGQLGTGAAIDVSSPVQIGALTTWAFIAAGNSTAHAIQSNGTLWAWGGSEQGALGDGTVVYRSSPVQIGSLTNWSKISSGYGATLAIKTDGTLWAWGKNASGAMGVGTAAHPDNTKYSSPIQVGTETNWTSISAGTLTAASFGIRSNS